MVRAVYRKHQIDTLWSTHLAPERERSTGDEGTEGPRIWAVQVDAVPLNCFSSKRFYHLVKYILFHWAIDWANILVTVHSCVAVLGRYIRAETSLRNIKEEGDVVVEEEVLTPTGTLMSTITPWRGDGFLLRTWQCGGFPGVFLYSDPIFKYHVATKVKGNELKQTPQLHQHKLLFRV